MATREPKGVRRRILAILYEHYRADPLEMLAPEDFLDDGTILREDLASNAYYLHERNLIELMVGYSPPMFAAARISPDGIDLVEDEVEMNRRFPVSRTEAPSNPSEVMALVMRLAQEADTCGLEGVRREWFLKDLERLRDEVRKPMASWRRDGVGLIPGWLDEYFDDGVEGRPPSLEQLKVALAEFLSE